jgi:hypothetical protein
MVKWAADIMILRKKVVKKTTLFRKKYAINRVGYPILYLFSFKILAEPWLPFSISTNSMLKKPEPKPMFPQVLLPD